MMTVLRRNAADQYDRASASGKRVVFHPLYLNLKKNILNTKWNEEPSVPSKVIFIASEVLL